jgi:hypothetical protein
MKQKDVALIIVIAFISAVASLLVSRVLFATPQNRQQAVQVVPAIVADFPTPDQHYFNSKSIDPTQLIHIGDNNNQNPFSGKKGQQ